MELSIITVACLGLLGLCLTLIVKPLNREIAVFISIVTSILLLMYALYHMRSLLEFLSTYFQKISGGGMYFSVLIKVLITAYAADFTAQLCRDAGENSIAGKVELAGKVIIFAVASPVILSVMELVSRLISL